MLVDTVKEIIENLNVSLTSLTFKDVNMLSNQVFIILLEVDNQMYYPDVYSAVISYINKFTITTTNNQIQEDFHKFRTKIDLLTEIKNENLKNIELVNKMRDEIMYEKVCHLKTLFQPEQRSPEWYILREEIFTASADVCDICSFNSKSKYSGTLAKVIMKKCGEGPVFTGNKYTEWGQKYEDIACSIYEYRYNKTVWEYGLLRHPTITVLGASPDGISTDGIMLEIKCPSGRKIDGKIKMVYRVQMQVQMEVCDLDRCDFFECNLTEYRNYDEYKDDIYCPEDLDCLNIMPKTVDLNFIKLTNDRRTSNGLEKGMIGTYYTNVATYEKKWVYPPFHLESDKQYKWLLEKELELKKEGYELSIQFWKLDLSSMNIVKRDRKWWEDNNITERLYKAWENVEDARINGTEKYLSKRQLNSKLKKKQMKLDMIKFEKENEVIMESCLMLDSDDENIKPIQVIKKVKVIKRVTKKRKKIKNNENDIKFNECMCLD